MEATRVRREEERLRVALNKARSRQLRVEQPYNIVTHSSLLPGQKQASLPLARARIYVAIFKPLHAVTIINTYIHEQVVLRARGDKKNAYMNR